MLMVLNGLDSENTKVEVLTELLAQIISQNLQNDDQYPQNNSTQSSDNILKITKSMSGLIRSMY